MLLIYRPKTLVEEALVEGLVKILLFFVLRQLAVRFLAQLETVVLNWLLCLCGVLPCGAPGVKSRASLVPMDELAVWLLLICLAVDLHNVYAHHWRLNPGCLGDLTVSFIRFV